jgi:uncharacterized protein YlaN (UPF0358 family)
MNRSVSLFLSGLLLLLAGCETPSYTGAGLFGIVPPQVRTFEADQKTVFYAAQKALKRMDYNLTRSRLSNGTVEATSNLRDTQVFGASRQFEFKIQIERLNDEQSEVAVRLFEHSEADFKSTASIRAVEDHGLYDGFFENLEAVLKAQVVGSEAGAP